MIAPLYRFLNALIPTRAFFTSTQNSPFNTQFQLKNINKPSCFRSCIARLKVIFSDYPRVCLIYSSTRQLYSGLNTRRVLLIFSLNQSLNVIGFFCRHCCALEELCLSCIYCVGSDKRMA